MLADMYVVRESEPCPPSTTIAEVASDPYGIYIPLCRRLEHGQQRLETLLRCVVEIVDRTAI